MSNAKSSYESQLVDQFAFNGNNKIFKYIKRIIKTQNLPVTMHLENQSATSDLDKASLFNSFFESVYSKEPASQDSPAILYDSQRKTLDLINITEEDPYPLLTPPKPVELTVLDLRYFILVH